MTSGKRWGEQADRTFGFEVHTHPEPESAAYSDSMSSCLNYKTSELTLITLLRVNCCTDTSCLPFHLTERRVPFRSNKKSGNER